MTEKQPEQNESRQKIAIASAISALEQAPFSREGLILELEEFGDCSPADAEFAAEHCGANWKEQAVLDAKMYLGLAAHSRKSLLSQLAFDKFPAGDAEAAVEHCGADWNEQARLKVKEYLAIMNPSPEELAAQLEFEGFTKEQAAYGLSQIDV